MRQARMIPGLPVRSFSNELVAAAWLDYLELHTERAMARSVLTDTSRITRIARGSEQSTNSVWPFPHEARRVISASQIRPTFNHPALIQRCVPDRVQAQYAVPRPRCATPALQTSMATGRQQMAAQAAECPWLESRSDSGELGECPRGDRPAGAFKLPAPRAWPFRLGVGTGPGRRYRDHQGPRPAPGRRGTARGGPRGRPPPRAPTPAMLRPRKTSYLQRSRGLFTT